MTNPIFEAYTVNDGTGHVRLPLRVFGMGAAIGASSGFGRVALDLSANGEGSQRNNGTGSVKLPGLMVRGVDTTNGGYGAVQLPLEVAGSYTPVLPSLAVGYVSLGGTGVLGAGKQTNFGEASIALPLRMFGSDASAFGNVQLPMVVYGSDGQSSNDRVAFLLEQPELLSTMVEGMTAGASSSMVIGHDSLNKQIVWVLRSVIAVNDASNTLVELVRSIDDRFGLGDLVAQVLSVHATSLVAFTDTAAANELRLLALMDRVALMDVSGSLQEATRAIALVLALTDGLATPTLAQMLSSVKLTEALLADVEAYARALDAVRLSSTLTSTLLLTMAIKDGLALTDTSNRLLEITRALFDSFAATISLQIDGVGYTAWVIGMDSKAVWSYADYPFNSFATIGGRRFGAGPDGISELVGSDDDGQAIAWSVQTGLTNMGNMYKKRLDIGYLGYTSAGEVGLAIMATDADGMWTQFNFTLEAITADDPVTNRVKLGRGIESVYYAFKYSGTGPVMLDNARILKMNTKRRV